MSRAAAGCNAPAAVVVLVHGALDELCCEGNHRRIAEHGNHANELDDACAT